MRIGQADFSSDPSDPWQRIITTEADYDVAANWLNRLRELGPSGTLQQPQC